MASLITVEELCEYLKVTRQAVYLMRKRGMPYKKIGRAVRFDLEEVKQWLDEQQRQSN